MSPKEEVELRSQVTVIGLGKHTKETLKAGRHFSLARDKEQQLA